VKILYPLIGFTLGMAIILPLMLTFDHARPLIAAGWIALCAVVYTSARASRLRRQRGASRS